MRRTLVAIVAGLVLLPASSAVAGPADDAAELSQTIEVAWLMPGPFRGYASFPQTYLPGGVPECGDGGVQVDVYKYGTPEVRELVDALVAGGVLNSPADDARVSAGRQHWFVELEPCDDPGDPGDPEDPEGPETEVESGGGGTPVVVVPTAPSAVPVVLLPAYAG